VRALQSPDVPAAKKKTRVSRTRTSPPNHAKKFYKETAKRFLYNNWQKFFKKWKKVFLKIAKSFIQKNWKKVFYKKNWKKTFLQKKLAKLLKQKHTNNFLKTFFTKLFFENKHFCKIEKSFIQTFCIKKEKNMGLTVVGPKPPPWDSSASTTAAVSRAPGGARVLAVGAEYGPDTNQ
jgi:hypothetical protein